MQEKLAEDGAMKHQKQQHNECDECVTVDFAGCFVSKLERLCAVAMVVFCAVLSQLR